MNLFGISFAVDQRLHLVSTLVVRDACAVRKLYPFERDLFLLRLITIKNRC